MNFGPQTQKRYRVFDPPSNFRQCLRVYAELATCSTASHISKCTYKFGDFP